MNDNEEPQAAEHVAPQDLGDAEQRSGEKKSGQKHGRPWYEKPSLIISIFALLVSIGSTLATILNNNAQSQNQDQQQLFTLVQDLNQVPAQKVTLHATYANNASQLLSLSGQLNVGETVEVQEAAQLIGELHNQVAAAEAEQVGNSLFDVGLYSQATNFYSIAISRGVGFPETIASSYRGWAGALYNLGDPAQARGKIALADSTYDSAVKAPSAQTQNHIFTSLYQLPFEIAVHNCKFVGAQFQADKQLATLLSTKSSSYVQDQAEMAGDTQSVQTCH